MIDSVDKAKRLLNHGTDGPITPFVLITRANILSFTSDYTEEITFIANALDELLTEYGWLKDGLVETGS